MNLDADITKGNPTPLWLEQYDRYLLYSDGAYILKMYTDLKDLSKIGYWELVECLQGWLSALDQSFVYGQKAQIANFVPTALRHIETISKELSRRKRPVKRMPKCVQPKPGLKLEARQVKLDADSMAVWGRYFPRMEKKGKVYQTQCPFPERHAHGDKKAAFTIYENGGAYCFVCNTRWDIIDAVQHFEGLSFTEAVGFVYQNFRR